MNIFQIAKRAKRARARLSVANKELKTETDSSKIKVLHMKQRVYTDVLKRVAEVQKNLNFIAAHPLRCALPKRVQRNLGLIPHLPNPNLAYAA